ncbi:MAG: response regulator [Rhodothermales bacterium]|nr:response regulator [Rhodothermales bacterium]MBO6779762.1 response regulator [Rhodothermales bacterium]
MIEILVADDHPLMRQALRGVLGAAQGITVVGEAKDGLETMRLAQALRPKLIILDMSMPEPCGIELIQQLSGLEQRVKVLPYSGFKERALVRGALESGAAGYMLKDEPLGNLLIAIDAVQREECWFMGRCYPSVGSALREYVGEPAGGTRSPAAAEVLSAYAQTKLLMSQDTWPGDVRELLTAINTRVWDEDLTIGGLISGFRADGRSLPSRFKRYAGMTPRRYLSYHRVRGARLLVEETGMPLSEAAAWTGFRKCFCASEGVESLLTSAWVSLFRPDSPDGEAPQTSAKTSV